MTWINDRIFAAGGEHLPKNWASFMDQTGITAVLHLHPISPTTFVGPAPTSFLWMGLEDEAQAGLDERWLAATFIGENLKNRRSVLIHSSLPRHRVRWTYVAYMIWNGRSVRASIREVEQRPWLAPYHTDMKVWKDFRQYVAACRSGEQPLRNNAGGESGGGKDAV